MTIIIPRALAFLDGQLPPAAREDPEQHRRGRLGLSFVGVFLTQVPVFIAVYLGFRVYPAALIVVAVGAAFLLTPRVMRRSLDLGNHYVIGILLAGLLGITACTGGPAAPALWWTYAIPVMAMMTLGARAGAAWLGVILGCTVAVHAASALGVQFAHAMLPWQTRLLGAVGASMLALVLFSLASTYESVRAAMLASLDRANDDMRLVLDNVEQGFVTVGRGGARVGMESAVIARWLGPAGRGETLPDWIARHNAATAAWLRLGVDDVFDDVLPREVTLAQLPRRFDVGARAFDLDYRPVTGEGDALRALVVIVSDATERVHAERAEAAQRELLAVVQHLARDRGGVERFVAEASSIVRRLTRGEDHGLRLVHTLKGNAGIFGLQTVAAVCHAVEQQAQQEERAPDATEVARVTDAWRAAMDRLAPILDGERGVVTVTEAELEAIERAIDDATPHAALAPMVSSLRLERVERVFQRMGTHAEAIARRIGRCEVEVTLRDRGARLDADRWVPVWAAMVHAVRNAVDHGGEDPAARVAAGKSPALRLTFDCAVDDAGVRVSLSDDGQGIDWDAVAARAESRGLPSETEADRVAALFADGVSTRVTVTEFSGRGVGLGALRDACASIGAELGVRSVRGEGTRIEVLAPHGDAQRAARAA
jgi:two-component system chemotaxis sensor kinase CheA